MFVESLVLVSVFVAVRNIVSSLFKYHIWKGLESWSKTMKRSLPYACLFGIYFDRAYNAWSHWPRARYINLKSSIFSILFPINIRLDTFNVPKCRSFLPTFLWKRTWWILWINSRPNFELRCAAWPDSAIFVIFEKTWISNMSLEIFHYFSSFDHAIWVFVGHWWWSWCCLLPWRSKVTGTSEEVVCALPANCCASHEYVFDAS